jgi:hypothetical protein
MTRNYKKNKNISMPLPRDSETLDDLIEDARDCNMSDKIGVFAGVRLAEYYKARREGRILPAGVSYQSLLSALSAVSQTWAGATPASTPSYNGYRSAPPSASGPSAAALERLKERPEIIQAAGADDLDEDDLAFYLEDDEEEEED